MRLIRGAPGSGKTALVFREFREALRQSGPPPVIVVPTATLVRHFQHELARDGAVFPPGCITSLNRFIAARAPERKPVPEGLLRVIVRDALNRLQLPEFAEVAITEGMVPTVIETIGLLGNAGASPERLAGVRKLSPHGKAFERVWRETEKRVRECGFATPSEMVRAAAANTAPLKILMDGFLHFSPLEAELIRALAATCDLTLTLTDTPATDPIRILALELGASDRLLAGGARRPPVTVVAAPTMEREADEIARRILQRHEGGTPFREMGVALRDTGAYLTLLRGTFERFGIPVRTYFSSPLSSHPAHVFLGGLVSCALAGWEFGAALDALRAHPHWGAGAAFDRFDFDVREAMPGRGADRLLALCEDEGLRRRIADCTAIAPWEAEELRPREWCHRLEKMASSLYRPGTVEPPRSHAEALTARSHAEALRAWIETVESTTAFRTDQEKPLRLEAYWRVVSEALLSAGFRTRDERRDAVHVMNAYEARQWDIGTLFVCGMTDRDFPRRNPQNLLFPDADIDVLRKAGIPARKATEQDREEEYLFESLKSRARDALVLTWPAHGAGGRSVESSRYVLTLDAARETALSCRPGAAALPAGIGTQGAIQSGTLLEALAAHHRRISLTALEDLAQCRFRFFAARTLGLKGRPERPQERLQPKVLGLIMHEALEAWLNVGRAGDFVELFETTFDRACREKHLPPGYRLEAERIAFREIARRVNATEQWTPLSSEAEVELTLDFPGGITVAGRVDRIDRMNDRDCIIVDYKSSKTAKVEKLVESAVRLQGPLYALAARERLGLNTIAMMYVAVRDDKRFGWGAVPGVADPAELNLKAMPPRWMEDARDRSVERIESFLAGVTKPEPTEPDECRWCDFKHACRVEQPALIAIGAAGRD